MDMKTSQLQTIMDCRNSGQLHESIRQSELLLNAMEDANDRASILENILICNLMLGRLSQARQALEELRMITISDAEVRLNAEFCEPRLLVEEGRREEAVRLYASILQNNSGLLKEEGLRYLYEDIQYRLALTLIDLQRYIEAIPLLEEAVSTFSYDNVFDAQQCHFALGICYEQTKAIQKAKAEFLRVVSCDLKTDIEERARYRLSILLFQEGAFAQAKHQLEMILTNHPTDKAVVARRYVYEQLSHTCRQLGDDTNAKGYLNLAQRERKR